MTQEIQAQERKTTAFQTTLQYIESDIGKKKTELHRKNDFFFFRILYMFIYNLHIIFICNIILYIFSSFR